MDRVEAFNSLPADDLLAVCAAPSWVARVAAGRPYGSRQEIVAAADAALRDLSWTDVLAALSAHPRIGERAAGNSREAAWSRREQSTAAADADEAPIVSGDLVIDPARRQAKRSGELVHLTPTEFDLLVFLGRSPGVVFSRERLLMEVWGYEDGSGPRTVDTHVAAVRRKVGSDAIRTAHGVGYAFGTAS